MLTRPSSDLAADKKLYVLSLHHPSPLDPPPADPAVAAAAASKLASEFEGFVMSKGKFGGGSNPNVPGPLPRYGDLGGIPYMVSEVTATAVVGICKARVKVEPNEVLDASNAKALASALLALQKLRDDAAISVGAAGGGGGAGGSGAFGECGDPPVMDPRVDFKINDIDVVQVRLVSHDGAFHWFCAFPLLQI